MSDIELIEEYPLSMPELKEKLEDIKKKFELDARANKTVDYLNMFSKASAKEALKLREKLKSLEISRLKEKHIAKIVDINPKDLDTLKTIFANEPLQLKPEELNKILEALK